MKFRTSALSASLLLPLAAAAAGVGALPGVVAVRGVSGFAPPRRCVLRTAAPSSPPLPGGSAPRVGGRSRFSEIGIVRPRSQRRRESRRTTESRRSTTETTDLRATTLSTGSDEPYDDESSEKKKKKPPFPLVLWRFTRPHTLIGSALAIPSLHLLAAPTLGDALGTANLVAVVFAMVPSLLMNLYITGLNQITDVDIDRINKPHLPIAAGDLSPRTAVAVVLLALAASLWMGSSHPVLGSQGLNVALWGSAMLGTMYSLPPFRLKRFPLLAALCIVAVRGTIINAGFFAHARSAAFGMRGSPAGSVLGCLRDDPKCLLSSAFFGVFGIVIALMKDVPDVGGDEAVGVRTLSVRAGRHGVFKWTRRLLTGLFLSCGAGFARGALLAPSRASTACRAGVSAAAFAAGLSVREEARPVDPEDSQQVYDYYMHLWKLFYLSYLFLPFAR